MIRSILCFFGIHQIIWEKPVKEAWGIFSYGVYLPNSEYTEEVQRGSCNYCKKSFKRRL